jgi:hypothetical protein
MFSSKLFFFTTAYFGGGELGGGKNMLRSQQILRNGVARHKDLTLIVGVAVDTTLILPRVPAGSTVVHGIRELRERPAVRR